MKTKRDVYIVHAVDTEGPLYESVEAKFDRLRELFGIDHISPSQENLNKLRNKKMKLNDKVSQFHNERHTPKYV